MKKKLSLFLIMVLLLSCIPFDTSAASSDATLQDKILQIDSLLDDRVVAYVNGDNERVMLINEKLSKLGAHDLSSSETANSLGRAANYETATEVITEYQGHSCKIIYLKPNDTRSSLWYSGGVDKKWYTPNKTAINLYILQSLIYSATIDSTPLFSATSSLYSICSDTQDKLDSYQTISNVQASYTYNCWANCIYVYFLNTSGAHYTLYARYAKITGESTASVYDVQFSDTADPKLTLKTCTHNISTQKDDYGSISVAYNEGKYETYNSLADVIELKGIDGTPVLSAKAPIPLYPGFA